MATSIGPHPPLSDNLVYWVDPAISNSYSSDDSGYLYDMRGVYKGGYWNSVSSTYFRATLTNVTYSANNGGTLVFGSDSKMQYPGYRLNTQGNHWNKKIVFGPDKTSWNGCWSYWVKPTSDSFSNSAMLFRSYAQSRSDVLWFQHSFTSDNKFRVTLNNYKGTGSPELHDGYWESSALSADTWYHIALRPDTTTNMKLRIYINGDIDTNTNATITNGSGTYHLNSSGYHAFTGGGGADSHVGFHNDSGTLGNIFAYDDNISSADINKIYLGYKGRFS